MGKSYITDDSQILVIEELPAYGSRIIDKNSGGLGGEIQFAKRNIDFFGTSGNILEIAQKKGDDVKKVFELPLDNEYCFKKDNLLEYMEAVKKEYELHLLNDYHEYKQDAYKYRNVNLFGWDYRKQLFEQQDNTIFFDLYIKAVDDTSNRCYLGSAESDMYTTIMAYTVIPFYTNLRIKKEDIQNGKSRFTFSLEYIEPRDIAAKLISDFDDEVDEKYKKSQEKLYEAAKDKNENSRQKTVTTVVYSRDADVAAYVKKRASGICDLCENEAPFEKAKRMPYLEEHHVDPLAEGGKDSIENAVALCPNCHRKMHIVKEEADYQKLLERLRKYKEYEI